MATVSRSVAVGLVVLLAIGAHGQAANRTPGPSESVSTGSTTLSAPTPSAKAPTAAPAPAPGLARAPGSPAPQPAGYPQTSVMYDVRNPEASDPLPLTGLLAAAPANTPEQIHLAFAGDTGMYVSWSSGPSSVVLGPVALPNVGCTNSVVKYGTSASSLSTTVKGSATAYTQLYPQVYGFERNYSSPYQHHVKLEDLTPNTRYFYTVGDGTAQGTSAVLNFTSQPKVGTTNLRLVVFADLGQSYNSSSTLDHMAQSLNSDTLTGAAAHLVYAADYSYSDTFQSNGTYTDDLPSSVNHLSLQSYQPREDSFGRLISPITQQYPFMGSHGNHELQIEAIGIANTTTFQSWLARYVFPWRESNSDSPFYYSYNYGAAHIISLSNYVWPNYKYDSPQYMWLQADLKAVNRTLTPWVIVQFHNPWYSTYSYSDFKQQDCFRQILEPLLYKYGVDLVYNGHVHSYERFYPVNDWQINECGYTSIVIGYGGNSEGLTVNYVDKPGNCMAVSRGAYYFQDICASDAAGYSGSYFPGGNASGFCPPANYQPSASAYREPSFGHGTLDIINSTHAFWQWHRNQDGNKITADQYYITRNTQRCPSKAGVTSGPVPQPAISPVKSYYSASCGPACNNYTGLVKGLGTNVDASGSIITPPSTLACPGTAPAAAPTKAPTRAPTRAPTPAPGSAKPAPAPAPRAATPSPAKAPTPSPAKAPTSMMG